MLFFALLSQPSVIEKLSRKRISSGNRQGAGQALKGGRWAAHCLERGLFLEAVGWCWHRPERCRKGNERHTGGEKTVIWG